MGTETKAHIVLLANFLNLLKLISVLGREETMIDRQTEGHSEAKWITKSQLLLPQLILLCHDVSALESVNHLTCCRRLFWTYCTVIMHSHVPKQRTIRTLLLLTLQLQSTVVDSVVAAVYLTLISCLIFILIVRDQRAFQRVLTLNGWIIMIPSELLGEWLFVILSSITSLLWHKDRVFVQMRLRTFEFEDSRFL